MSQSNEDNPVVLDHDYDGIKEYDNPLPTWWLITFFITIIFGFHYWLDSEFAERKTQVQEVQEELAAIKAQQTKTAGTSDNEEDYKRLAAITENIDKGKVVFTNKCATCHGPEGQGLIGPNLTDDYWIHGKGKYVDISEVIRSGVQEKGMPPWGNMLSSEDLQQVTVFVASLAKTTPANPKPPQGEKVSP